MASIPQVLQQKRAQLEQEIADFTTKKVDEFRSFEQEYLQAFRNERGLTGRDNGVLCPETNGQPLDEVPRTRKTALSLSSNLERPSQEDGDENVATVDEQDGSNHTRTMPSLSKLPQYGEGLSFSQRHERESEFKGLFTPPYLPLLSNQGIDSNPGSGERRQCSEDKPSLTRSQQNTASLSSSATLPGPHVGFSQSPSPARPLSASVPKQPDHHRRASSRSDISLTSLRSSLRDPKQPRSPKRVLFSLDNLVVSPSTSPAAQRSKMGENTVHSTTLNVPRPLGSFGPIAIEGLGGNSLNTLQDRKVQQARTFTGDGTNFGNNAVASASTTSVGKIDMSPIIGGDDFETIDADEELFTFDEDMNSGQAEVEANSDADDPGSEDDEQNGEALIASSPHAGSLPIEIKWPQKHWPH
ncbi:MAG: hypothetical protein HETSPECPRED_001635 [Heterodermia speciosa]|uniref:Uncharacterized protein n=1 Tax=Heterodermia speciosa TaxID=116794 RepID=A0A8H3EYF8_9LECA|nr:MAG: hypothetical protein HETSPECPRED_001635 [Heterodermia speciosa]